MCVLQWFERNVLSAPDAVAIANEGRQLTYRELNSTADRIQHGLREAGVSAGSLVAILLDRSPEMVAALLGIWKAGAAYVPLDPAAPTERIIFMLEDTAAPFVLTRRKFFSRIPGRPSLDPRLLDLDEFLASANPS